MRDLAKKLDSLRTPVGVLGLELDRTIEVICKRLYSLLSDEDDFCQLNEEAARRVTFYVALMRFPHIIKEIIKNRNRKQLPSSA